MFLRLSASDIHRADQLQQFGVDLGLSRCAVEPEIAHHELGRDDAAGVLGPDGFNEIILETDRQAIRFGQGVGGVDADFSRIAVVNRLAKMRRQGPPDCIRSRSFRRRPDLITELTGCSWEP